MYIFVKAEAMTALMCPEDRYIEISTHWRQALVMLSILFGIVEINK